MLHINHRRRLLAVLAATALSVLIVFPAAARVVVNGSDQALVAQVVWGDVDPETGAGAWGILVAYDQAQFDGVSLVERDATLVDCGGWSALSGTFRMGDSFAPSHLAIARNLASGSATAAMTIYSGTFDDCTGSYEITSVEEDVAVSIDLVATGVADNTVERHVEYVPDEFRVLQTDRMATRTADGTATIGGAPLAFDAAQLSKHSANFHFHGF